MSKIKNFDGFFKTYENKNQKDVLVKKGREALEQAENDAKEITSKDTGIANKLKAAKNATKNDRLPKTPIKESVNNEETVKTVKGLTNLIVKLKEYVLPKLPVLTGSYPEGWECVDVKDYNPSAIYKASELQATSSGVTIAYKDEKGTTVRFAVTPSKGEIEHIREIFVEACERTKWISFLKTTGVVSGIAIAAAGIAVILYGVYAKYKAFDEWKNSFFNKGQDYPKTVTTSPFDFGSDIQGSAEYRDRRIYTAPDFSENPMTGYGVLGGELGKDALVGAGGILGGVLLSLGSSKIKSDVEILDQITSITGLLKVSLEPLGMKVDDLKTAGDITTVLTTDQSK